MKLHIQAKDETHILLRSLSFPWKPIIYSKEQDIQNKGVIANEIKCLIDANKDPYISSSIEMLTPEFTLE